MSVNRVSARPFEATRVAVKKTVNKNDGSRRRGADVSIFPNELQAPHPSRAIRSRRWLQIVIAIT